MVHGSKCLCTKAQWRLQFNCTQYSWFFFIYLDICEHLFIDI